MTTVKVLVDGVGDYNAGDVVRNAPDGLVEIATSKTRNAASGELLAEIIEGGFSETGDAEKLRSELKDAKESNQKLHQELAESKKREADLRAQLDELTKPPAGQTGDDLDELRAQAKELKVPGYTKMGADELRAAINAAGGEEDAK